MEKWKVTRKNVALNCYTKNPEQFFVPFAHSTEIAHKLCSCNLIVHHFIKIVCFRYRTVNRKQVKKVDAN